MPSAARVLASAWAAPQRRVHRPAGFRPPRAIAFERNVAAGVNPLLAFNPLLTSVDNLKR